MSVTSFMNDASNVIIKYLFPDNKKMNKNNEMQFQIFFRCFFIFASSSRESWKRRFYLILLTAVGNIIDDYSDVFKLFFFVYPL